MAAKKELELYAYKAVVRAFMYKSNSLSNEEDDLLMSLRDLMKISNDDHRAAKKEALEAGGGRPPPPAAPLARAPSKGAGGLGRAPSKKHAAPPPAPRRGRPPAAAAPAPPGGGIDRWVGKILQFCETMYDDSLKHREPSSLKWHKVVVIAYNEDTGLHRLAFNFNEINEDGASLETYDDISLYKEWDPRAMRDTHKTIDFSRIDQATVVRGAPAPAEPAPDAAAAAAAGAQRFRVESKWFPDLAMETENASDRQALQEVREKIYEKDQQIRTALEELRAFDKPKPAAPAPAPAPAATNGGGQGAAGPAPAPEKPAPAPAPAPAPEGEPAAPAAAAAAAGDEPGSGTNGDAAPTPMDTGA